MTRHQQMQNERIEEIIKWKACNGTLPNFCFMTADDLLWFNLMCDMYTLEKGGAAMTTASAKELREAAQLLTELAGDARSVKAPKIADTNELAAALCIERAEQMERGEQSFSDWLTSQYSIIDMAKRAELKAAWHAATAQMQARVNNAASVTNSFKEQLLVAKAKLDAATNLWTCKSCGARFDKIPHDDSVDRCTRCVEFDAAQKRVAELEARMELLAAWVRNEHSGASLPSDTVSAMIYIANERGKQHTHLIERLATAQVNVATLCEEVRRIQEWLTPGTKVNVLSSRPAEVRALVGTTADIKDT